MNFKITVIIPVYNVENYLRECLDSLAHQSLKDIEVIIVNDGSTDQSQSIIDEYTQRYSHFKCIQKKNGGLSDARNVAIPHALGEYISFIDSDDYVETDFCELMFTKAKETSALLTVCDIEVFFDNKSKNYTLKGLRNIKGKTTIQSAFLSPLFAWNKLYHRSLFDDPFVRYPIGLWYEDIPVTIPMFSKLEIIAYVDKSLIHYRQRETSIMGSKNADKLIDIFTILNLVYNDFRDRHQLEKYQDEIEYLFIEHLLLYGAFRFYRSNKSELYMSKAFEVMNTHFPHWRKNPYINEVGKYKIYLKTLSVYTWKFYKLLTTIKG